MIRHGTYEGFFFRRRYDAEYEDFMLTIYKQAEFLIVHNLINIVFQLVLIRAVGFFLNPVYRFWLDPTVLRDVMHEYVPESRTKTVQSLMAAGVREMVRPNKIAYLQRIVRNLSSFKVGCTMIFFIHFYQFCYSPKRIFSHLICFEIPGDANSEVATGHSASVKF
ncbi:unnamed protein product, partial [Anisakis simplex]|uniref:Anoctamin n=1 Tax=Anisakis simplex TaxID=6269 RepID=A0A0M3JAX3_ANISI